MLGVSSSHGVQPLQNAFQDDDLDGVEICVEILESQLRVLDHHQVSVL